MFVVISLLVTVFISIITPLPAQAIEQRIEPVKMELSTSQVDWLNKLEDHESSGSTTIKILDNNNKYSYGCLQFQSHTFLTQGKMYGLVDKIVKKAEPLIYNCELQKEIAHKMLLDGGEYHWKNTVRRYHMGKYPK